MSVRGKSTSKSMVEILGTIPRMMNVNHPDRPPVDRTIWICVTALMALGTVMVLSSSVILAERKFGTPAFFWGRQLMWWGLASVLMIVVSRIDHRRFRPLAPAILLSALVGLIVVLWLPSIRGVHRWIPLGFFSWQPAEGFRLAFIVYAAAYLAKRGTNITQLKSWIPLAIILGVCSVLLILEPALSMVITMCATAALMLVAAGARWRHLLPGALIGVCAVVFVVYGLEYKTQRVTDWERGLTVTDGSYQVRQSKMALGSGGMFGDGLGSGRAKMLYLPEPHTDFIIASIGEELGFIGVSAVLAALALLVWRGWRVAMIAPDRFGYLLCIGIGGSLFINAALNLSVATGLSPATGLPLPFVSYGGSSLLMTAAGWGIVLNVSSFRHPGAFRRSAGWRRQ